MDLHSHTLEELETHVTPSFSGNGDTVSVSPLRLNSYLNNPRAEATDPVLLEMHHEGRLVAYRTLVPDLFIDKHGTPQRFAWLSGNYVDPDFRRQGLSTRLLQTAEALWDGNLLYTNYAPTSKAVYDRTGQFPTFAKREGKRFYLRSASKELLGERLGNKDLLATGDQMINRLRESKLQKFQEIDGTLCKIERITSLDPMLIQMIESSQKFSLFQRDESAFSWILNYPWVTEIGVIPIKYHFTYHADNFQHLLIKFTMPRDEGLGLLWLTVHNQKLSAPYLFENNNKLYASMARTLIHTMISKNCAYATIRNPILLQHLMEHRKWFLSIRNMPQLLFAHKTIGGQIPEDKIIHDGDGDVVFTG